MICVLCRFNNHPKCFVNNARGFFFNVSYLLSVSELSHLTYYDQDYDNHKKNNVNCQTSQFSLSSTSIERKQTVTFRFFGIPNISSEFLFVFSVKIFITRYSIMPKVLGKFHNCKTHKHTYYCFVISKLRLLGRFKIFKQVVLLLQSLDS